jgi:hypothetical protein
VSTIKSSAEDLTLNADGSGNDIKFQINAVEKASISSAGLLTSTTIDATALTGNLPAIDGSSLTGISAGITEADQWRLNTSFSGGGDITTNLERNDSASFSTLGTGMTESSGVFAFPSTGYWLVTFNLGFLMPVDDYAGHNIYYTGDDGSNWVLATRAMSSSSSAAYYHSIETKEIFDITDIANQKVKFNSGAGTTTNGVTDYSMTSMVFIKLGAT